MITFDMYVDQEEVIRELQTFEGDNSVLLMGVLETIGYDTVTFLRSLTTDMRPPARTGEPPRAAHPGGWADVTSNLANAYRFEVRANGRLLRWSEEGGDQRVMIGGIMPSRGIKPPLELRLINDMEYAAYLEGRHGYFVLSGVTDPGGPVDRAIRRVASAVPGWRLEG